MLKSLVLALSALVLSASFCFAEEPLKIVVAHDATWPPMEFMDEQRNVVGYSVDYIDAVAKEAGLIVEHKSVAWNGILTGLKSKRYDVVASSVTITPERGKIVNFTIPYYEVKQALVVPVATAVSSLDDMAGKRLGAQIGTTGFMAIKANPKIVSASYNEIGLAMEALSAGKIDGVVCDAPVATNFIMANKEYATKMKVPFIIPADEPEHYGFALEKGNDALTERINKGIQAVKDKGIEQQLIDKWMSLKN